MLWDKSTVYEPNANGEERICSARRQQCEPVRRDRRRPNSGQSRKQLRKAVIQISRGFESQRKPVDFFPNM
jgi:hypothetical protein